MSQGPVDRYECRRCFHRFGWRRPQRQGQYRRVGRMCPYSGVWDPEYGVVEGGDPHPSCPNCGHVYVGLLSGE